MGLANRKRLGDVDKDEVYVIYGPEGTGKTVLASTFPKSKEEPLYYLDVKEGGAGSIPTEFVDEIEVVEIEDFEDLDNTLTGIAEGAFKDATGAVHELKPASTIVIDSVTNVEPMMKKYAMKLAGKSTMNIGLWGDLKDLHNTLTTLGRELHKKTGAKIVFIAHEKELTDENRPELNRRVPSIMTSAQKILCAKASYVWYTGVEFKDTIDPATSEMVKKAMFFTIIDASPNLSSKCRKPPKFTGVIPNKIYNNSYKKFSKEVLDKLPTK